MIGCLCLGVVGCFPWVEPGVSWWLFFFFWINKNLVGGFGLNVDFSLSLF